MSKDFPVLEQRLVAFAASFVKQHGVSLKASQLAALRKALLTMLAVWIGYFFLIQLFVRKLNQIVVPLIEIPLSIFLVAQGLVFVFLTALWILRRHTALANHL